MGNNQIEVFESSLQKTNLWLKDIEAELHNGSRQKAYVALRSVIHVLRDCLPLEQAVKFASQMPMIISGAYYEGWAPRRKPERLTRTGFFDAIRLQTRNPGIDPALAARAVIKVFFKHISRGEMESIRRVLPREVREFWDEAAAQAAMRAPSASGRRRINSAPPSR